MIKLLYCTKFFLPTITVTSYLFPHLWLDYHIESKTVKTVLVKMDKVDSKTHQNVPQLLVALVPLLRGMVESLERGLKENSGAGGRSRVLSIK